MSRASRQRATSAQVIDLERADALGHQAIEAANALQLALVHSLTLVRYLPDFKRQGICAAAMRLAKKLADAPIAARQFVIGDRVGEAKETIAGRPANGVSLTASVNSARRPAVLRISHRGSRPREKSVHAGAQRGNALLAENVEGYGAPWSGDYDAKRGIRTSVRATRFAIWTSRQ